MYMLREFRTKNKLSQEAVASYLGTAQHHYSRYENETIDIPGKRILQLCDLFQCSADELLGRSENQAIRGNK